MNQISLFCKSMDYNWGKIGEESFVYQLLKSTEKNSLSNSSCYAELWMGDHEKAPSLTPDGKRLSQICQVGCIPFLFKVLSIAKPLSIQVHPSKELAEIFHSIDPTNFPDDNHKPEMAIFIKETTLLCGFRPYNEIINFLNHFNEFKNICGIEDSNNFIINPNSNNLKKLVLNLLSCDSKIIFKESNKLYNKIHNNPLLYEKELIKAFELIKPFFPNDIGFFFPLFLNIIIGPPGTALFIKHGVLHAYLSGDLFEAMAVSDNVVRAGMTPKRIDLEKLIQAVSFECQLPHYILPEINGPLTSYICPTKEFKVFKLKLNDKELFNLTFQCSTIMIVLSGEGFVNNELINKGKILLFYGNSLICFESINNLECFFCTSG